MPKLFGQKKLAEEINLLIKDIISGVHHNILLRAPSGYGKTSMALNILYHLGWDKSGEYIFPENGLVSIDERKIYHVIDEVHELVVPEDLYPLMDNHQHTFILCSNESGALKEPLRNRCIQFIFQPYSDDEMLEMVTYFLQKFNLPEEFLKEIRSRTKNIPRVANKLCERLAYVFTWKGIPNNLDELIFLMEELLLVYEGGLNQNDLAYIDFLSKVGQSSLENISAVINVDKDTIRSEIEPWLLYRGLMKITSRGRIWL